jgi:hypothetical protein
MTMKSAPATSPSTMETQTAEPPLDLQEQIRRRAFALYELRGRGDGHDRDDWLQAESELAQLRTKAAAA